VLGFVAGSVLVASAGSARAAGDRLAVLIVADQDPELSDNLTEVAISKLAERRQHRLVGWRELHDQLADILDRPDPNAIAACVDEPDCLARIGAAAHVDAALIGEVRRQDDRTTVRLVLVNVATAARDAEFSETVGPDVADLIAAVRRGVDVVSTPKPARLALEPAHMQAALETAPSPPGPPTVSAVHAAPHRSRWTAPLGYTAGALAVASFSAAVVTGALSIEKPTGDTREAAQSDLERRDRYASIANGLYLTAGVLAVTSAALLLSQLLPGQDD